MKRAALGALLISLVAGSTAFAGTLSTADHNNHRRYEREHRQNHHQNHHQDRRDHDRRNDHRYDHRRDNDHRWHDGRRNDHRWDNNRHDRRWEKGRWHWGPYHRPHGYVHRHWVRGQRLPVAYYAPHYVIRDYRHCGLRHPPHGYHWVRVNNDAVLAVIATGVILDVVYNQFW